MRLAKINKYQIHKEEATTELIKLNKKPSLYMDDIDLFEDKKELAKFVKRLKAYIRKSFEYKRLMQFLKRNRGMDVCGIHPNITSDKGYMIHIHHTPFCMEDIIYVVINKRLRCNESLKMCDIAYEIMKLHYMGFIGLYPLDETCHEYAHSDSNTLFIPTSKTFGDSDVFFEAYKDYMEEPLQLKYMNFKELEKGYEILGKFIPEEMLKKYIYIVDEETGDSYISAQKLYTYITELQEERDS